MALRTTSGLAKRPPPAAKKPSPTWLASANEAYDTLRQTFASRVTATYEWRMGQLDALENIFLENQKAICQALDTDLRRPEFESLSMDIGPMIAEIRNAKDQLQHWMEPVNVPTDLLNQPASSVLHHTPKGVVLVIGPWNFPFVLLFRPLVSAITAGNCVILKPSEVASASERLIAELCGKYLDQSAVRVLCGAVAETSTLLDMKFDHIFYTGNGAVGRIVMTAAAKHLTPVTLELGGKCPVIVDKGLSESKMKVACRRILQFGLYANAGQICMSPDYVLVHKDALKLFKRTVLEVVKEFTPRKGADVKTALGKIVATRHFDRIAQLIDTSGGELWCGGTHYADREDQYLPPTVIFNPNQNSSIMYEEIFGPVMVVVAVDNVDNAIRHINERETPLVLYMVTESKEFINHVLHHTQSGSVLVNDAVVHVGNLNMPFGGVGASGMGRYHGKFGFEEFSHMRPVMVKGLSIDADRYPPYSQAKVNLIRKLQLEPLMPAWLPKAAVGLAAVAGGIALRSHL